MRGRLFVRSLLVQAAWNSRNLLGTGLAWGMQEGGTPSPSGDPESAPSSTSEAPDPEEAPESDTEWVFNAHPYLAGVAMGALRTMEEEGAPRDDVKRFRAALRGPLGSLGDALVWAGWVPAALAVAGVALVLGVPPLAAVALFLILHNGLHLLLRWWGVGVGLAHGRGVALAFQRANLGGWARKARTTAVFSGGVLAGVLGVTAARTLDEPGVWLSVLLATVVVGMWRGISLPVRLPGVVTLGVLGLGWLATLF